MENSVYLKTGEPFRVALNTGRIVLNKVPRLLTTTLGPRLPAWSHASGRDPRTLPAKIVKNKEPVTLALTAELTAVLKKQFRQTGQLVFDATNLRREWASATVAAKCPELLIHDLRRSGARNLVNAGCQRRSL